MRITFGKGTEEREFLRFFSPIFQKALYFRGAQKSKGRIDPRPISQYGAVLGKIV